MITVRIKAIPIKMVGRLIKVDKTLEYVPVAINSDGKILSDYFIKKVIKRENIDKYRISYEVLSKKYLSGLCHNVKN